MSEKQTCRGDVLKNGCDVSINIENSEIPNQQIMEIMQHIILMNNLLVPKRFYSGFRCISLALVHVDFDRKT